MAEKDDKKREPESSEQKHEAARDQAEAEARAETHAVSDQLDETLEHAGVGGKGASGSKDGGGRPPGATPPKKGAAWADPLVRVDEKWTKWETWLCAIVLILEIAALSLWVSLKGLSTPPGGAKAGIVFRAIFGSTLLGLAGYWGLKKQGPKLQRIAAIGGVVLGLLLAKSWARVGVDWSSNLLNWYQQASTLTLFGGLRGVGTRLTLMLALLGGSLATAAGRHITIDLVTRYLKPKVKLPVTLVGWIGASLVCFAASWGFFDHIAIEDFGSKAEATAGQKVSTVTHGLGENFFILRKQVSLDFKSLPHILKGEPYADWFSGREYNDWLENAGFVERYGREAVDALRIPDDDKRSPMVAIPGKGEPRGALTHAANLVFPFGLFVIALRFILLALLAISGHKSIETEAHLDLGMRPHDEGETKEVTR